MAGLNIEFHMTSRLGVRAVSLILLSVWLHTAGGPVLSANELAGEIPVWRSEAPKIRHGEPDLRREAAAGGEKGSLSQACNAGDGEACFKLGAIEAEGMPNKAIPSYRRACVLGFRAGCRVLGEAYIKGAGVTRDRTKGETLLRKACDADDIDACFTLASVPGVRDQTDLLERACDAQVAEACYRLGSLYGGNPLIAGLPTINEAASSYFQQACNAGHQKGCEALRRPLPAVKTYERLQKAEFKRLLDGCSKNDVSACGQLATAFSRGWGVEKNAEIAFGLHQRVCDAGELKSCVRLALAYLQGAGTEPDSALGIGLLSDSCAAGEADGCYWLGLSYQKGFGVEKNESEARAWLEKACDTGDVSTCGQARSYLKLMDERQ